LISLYTFIMLYFFIAVAIFVIWLRGLQILFEGSLFKNRLAYRTTGMLHKHLGFFGPLYKPSNQIRVRAYIFGFGPKISAC